MFYYIDVFGICKLCI